MRFVGWNGCPAKEVPFGRAITQNYQMNDLITQSKYVLLPELMDFVYYDFDFSYPIVMDVIKVWVGDYMSRKW